MKRNFLSLLLIMVFFAFAANAQINDVANSDNTKGASSFVITHGTSYAPTVKGVIFEDDFSTDLSWTYEPSWERAVASAGSVGDPAEDHTATADEFLIGTAVGDNYGNGENVSATSPVIDCTGESVVNLTYWSYSEMENGWDEFYCEVSNDGSTWVDVGAGQYPGETEWTEHTFDISATAANQSTVYIRFRIDSDNTVPMRGMSIDDVSLNFPEPNDLAAISVSPSGLISSGSAFIPTVTIQNIGSADQTTYDVQLVSDPAGYDFTVSDVAITAGETLVLDGFDSWAPADGTYDLTATVTLSGDVNPANDVCTSTIEVAVFVFGDIVSTFGTEAGGCPGIETDGTNIYTVYWNPAVAGRNFDKYTMDGTFVEEFSISGVSAVRDMAYNPNTGFFYGAAASTSLFEMDLYAQTLESTITAPIACRAILYDDDDDTFWANNFTSDLTEFDMSGTATGNSFTPPSIYGAAYDNWTDPANPTIWVHEGTTSGDIPYLTEFALDGTATGRQIDISTVPGYTTGIAGGLATFEEDGIAYLLANIQQSPNLIAKIVLFVPEVDTYTVTFTVTDNDGGAAIDGALIDIEAGTYTATTDVDGLATFDLENGDYDYAVTYTDYDTYSGTFTVADGDEDVAVGLDKSISVNDVLAKGISIYPNPSNGVFNVNVESNFNLEILDITGKVINTRVLTGNSTVEINTAGVYFLRFSNKEGSVTQRVIVQ